MKTLRQLLQDGDPVGRESGLTLEDAERMRRAMLAADRPTRSRPWAARIALVVGLGVIVGVGAWFGRAPRFLNGPSNDTTRLVAPTDAKTSRRQVQFATPSGTRIIWIFDSNFDVR
jgi:hypothetical protein